MALESPSNAPLQRSLSILRRLQRGPAERDALADHVRIDVDPSAYADFARKADQQLLANDIKRLRSFGVEIDHYDGQYHLASYGAFSPVALTETDLNTLAFLIETFGPGTPNAEDVQQLVRTMADWLPESQRDSISGRRQRLRVDLRRKDNDRIDPAVEAAVNRAWSGRRLLRFAYRSLSQSDGVLRVHTVQPWHVYFDSVRGHFYLDGYCVEVIGPHGPWKRQQWQQYRLGRILAEGIEVLPDRLPPEPPKRPRHPLEYWLAPEVARLGEVTRHFDNTQTHETDADGWVRVTATASDLFGAVRQLLHYGPYCKVTGGSEARREMEKLVQAMARLYGD
jgi:predicted DNA-binding transcriptional regulator YafY